MIDHISIGVRDLDRSARFYEAVLGTLGYAKLRVWPGSVGFGKKYPEFWINHRPSMPPGDTGVHVCVRASHMEQVGAFHAAALAAPLTPFFGREPELHWLTGVLAPTSGRIFVRDVEIDPGDYSVRMAHDLAIETVYQDRSLADKQPLWRNFFVGRQITNRFGFIDIAREKAIDKGIAAGHTARRGLPAAMPIFIVYQTSYVESDGSVQFRSDPYGRDEEIWHYLMRAERLPVAQESAAGQRKG